MGTDYLLNELQAERAKFSKADKGKIFEKTKKGK